jgi:hypothetical protein
MHYSKKYSIARITTGTPTNYRQVSLVQIEHLNLIATPTSTSHKCLNKNLKKKYAKNDMMRIYSVFVLDAAVPLETIMAFSISLCKNW